MRKILNKHNKLNKYHFMKSVVNKQMHKCSTIYYITLVTMPLHVWTLLRHPQGVGVQCLPSYISI
jgi:hypothetical protein